MKKLTPSALPALLVCKDYEDSNLNNKKNAGLKEVINNGILQHAYLRSLVEGEKDDTLALTSSEMKNIERAYRKMRSFIRDVAPKATIEAEVELITWRLRGFADAVAWDAKNKALVIIDYKSHETQKDYKAQIMWYASAWMEEHEDCKPAIIHLGILFGDTGRFNITTTKAVEVDSFVIDMFNKIENGYSCTASPWCSNCERRGQCKVAADSISAFKETAKIEKRIDHLAERLNESIEIEKRIKEMKSYAKERLEEGDSITSEDRTYGFKLQETTNYGIDFERAFAFFMSTRNDALVEELLQNISIPKATVDLLLQKVEGIEEMGGRGKVLRSLLDNGKPVKRLKRVLL